MLAAVIAEVRGIGAKIIKFYEVIYKILTKVCTSDSKVDRSSI